MRRVSAIDAFNRDAERSARYPYADASRLSSVLANRRLTDAVLSSADFRDKRVLDVGCGDGTYTLALFASGQPRSIHGIDRAERAVELARTRVGNRPITYEVGNAEALQFPDDSFDIVQLRGILHHADRPFDVLREAIRVAPVVVVTEPNGYNPVLKVLEKTSRYHIEHDERSIFPARLEFWAKQLAGPLRSSQFVGLVPFFCPAPFARLLKAIEPILERIPFLRSLSCGTFVFVVDRQRDVLTQAARQPAHAPASSAESSDIAPAVETARQRPHPDSAPDAPLEDAHRASTAAE